MFSMNVLFKFKINLQVGIIRKILLQCRYGGFYTKVSSYHNWILENTRDANYCKNPYWERNIEETEATNAEEDDDINQEKTKSDENDKKPTTEKVVRATQADPDSKALITNQISNILIIILFFIFLLSLYILY